MTHFISYTHEILKSENTAITKIEDSRGRHDPVQVTVYLSRQDAQMFDKVQDQCSRCTLLMSLFDRVLNKAGSVDGVVTSQHFWLVNRTAAIIQYN